jgi:Helix-turn-helix domain
MSFKLIAEVWRLQLTATQQHVLMAMADYADDDGRNCFPSQPRLAWKTGFTTKTIQRTIPELIAIGVVKMLRPATNKAPPRYQLCLDMGEIKAPFHSEYDDSRVDKLSSQEESRVDNLSTHDDLGGHCDCSRVDIVSARVDTMSTDPIINLSTNQPGNKMIPLPETTTEKRPKLTAAETAQKWAACIAEMAVNHKTMAEWLQGSELIATGAVQDGKPLYQVLVVNPRHVEWIKERAGRNLRWQISSMLRMPVAVDIIGELAAVPS